MLGPKELDARLVGYNPNLSDITEAAMRTYGAANAFYDINELNMQNIEFLLSTGDLSTNEDVYDKSHITVSLLAECCEMYLKALFLYEKRNSGKSVEELWRILEAKDEKNAKDQNGNTIYYQTERDNETPLKHSDGTIIYVYAKVDSNGDFVNGSDGKPVYVDKLGNEYSFARKGRAVKTNGHSLDRLVLLISPQARLMLESRMLNIKMDATEKNKSVSIYDLLLNNGIISPKKHISKDQYEGWLDQHKRAFEESRYPGQKKYDINVEFMYHLENQIRAVCQYMIVPNVGQQFTVKKSDLEKLPEEIGELAEAHLELLSEDLIKLIISDEKVKHKIVTLFSQKSIIPRDISSKEFYELITNMSASEIIYISYICYMTKYYSKLDLNGYNNGKTMNDKTIQALKIAMLLNQMKFSQSYIVQFCLQLKELFHCSIDNDTLTAVFNLLDEETTDKLDYNLYNFKKYYKLVGLGYIYNDYDKKTYS